MMPMNVLVTAASRRVPLRAPIPGVVSELMVREGTMVQAGTPAFTLTDLGVSSSYSSPKLRAVWPKLGLLSSFTPSRRLKWLIVSALRITPASRACM